MAYSNVFLRDFRPVFLGILREKQIRPERVELKVIDDEEEGEGIFEPVGVREVLGQLAEDLNYLTIYTERPAYFYEFTETMYEENGLIVELFSKKALAWSAPCRMDGPRRRVHPVQRMGDGGENAAGSMMHAGGHGRRRCGEQRAGRTEGAELILDFEWNGDCYPAQIRPGRYYIPIHKKPWKRGENLDIAIPIGYNTVIIREVEQPGRQPARDRFEEAFYDL